MDHIVPDAVTQAPPFPGWLLFLRDFRATLSQPDADALDRVRAAEGEDHPEVLGEDEQEAA